jgi:hypothetical protein
MKKLHKDFPVFLIENFHDVSLEELDRLIPIIVGNKNKYRVQGAASFWLVEDDEFNTFDRLYKKFEDTIKQFVSFTVPQDNTRLCNIYHSTKNDFVEVLDAQGRPFYHNHKHVEGHLGNITTMSGVYYMNIPEKNAGPIDFKRDFEHMEDGSLKAIDIDLKYSQIKKRPYEPIPDMRITTMKEISYQPKNGDLVLFPSYLDHRPHVIESEGHRVAINFELKTIEHPDTIVNQLDLATKTA